MRVLRSILECLSRCYLKRSRHKLYNRLMKKKFKEGEAPGAYAFALLEHRGGREALTLLTFLVGEDKQLDNIEAKSNTRLLKMLSVLKESDRIVWIKKVGLSRQSFVQIQGPPGTGKTQTILGLLSAVLHSSPARVQSRGQSALSRRLEMPMQDKTL